MYVYEASPFSPNSRATKTHGATGSMVDVRVRTARLVPRRGAALIDPPLGAAAEDGDPDRDSAGVRVRQ